MINKLPYPHTILKHPIFDFVFCQPIPFRTQTATVMLSMLVCIIMRVHAHAAQTRMVVKMCQLMNGSDDIRNVPKEKKEAEQ